MTRRLKMTRMIPTSSRISPTLWMLNPEVCTETANLSMAPTTTSTIPNDVRPMPEFLFMALKHRLIGQMLQAARREDPLSVVGFHRSTWPSRRTDGCTPPVEGSARPQRARQAPDYRGRTVRHTDAYHAGRVLLPG